MSAKYESLRKKYPSYISLGQFYQICHIAKRSALYLLENGIVPAIDTGKKTWRYKIALDDVITYLRRREQWGSCIPPGAVSSRPAAAPNHRVSLSMHIKRGDEEEVYRYFERLYAKSSDALGVQEIMAMTGLSDKTVLQLLKAGNIKSIAAHPRYIVPKTFLLEFLTSRRYIDLFSNSEGFVQIVEGFKSYAQS